MTPINAFLLSLAILLALSVSSLAWLHRSMFRVLTEICGAEHRALFWTRFFGAMVLLAVLFFGLWSAPEQSSGFDVFESVVAMTRAGLFGLLAAFLAVGLVMQTYILRFERCEAATTKTVPRGLLAESGNEPTA